MLGGSCTDAEDATQDVFFSAYRALRHDDRPITLRAWLYRIAHNRCIDQIRRPGARGGRRAGRLPHAAARPGRRSRAQREACASFVTDIGRLPEQQRSAALMRWFDGLGYAEIAAALGVSVKAVKSLLVRARVSVAEADEARNAACADIRAELAAALRPRRADDAGARCKHLRDCAACREYRTRLRDAGPGARAARRRATAPSPRSPSSSGSAAPAPASPSAPGRWRSAGRSPRRSPRSCAAACAAAGVAGLDDAAAGPAPAPPPAHATRTATADDRDADGRRAGARRPPRPGGRGVRPARIGSRPRSRRAAAPDRARRLARGRAVGAPRRRRAAPKPMTPRDAARSTGGAVGARRPRAADGRAAAARDRRRSGRRERRARDRAAGRARDVRPGARAARPPRRPPPRRRPAQPAAAAPPEAPPAPATEASAPPPPAP